MVPATFSISFLSCALAAMGSPMVPDTARLSMRQNGEIPPNDLYLVEWFPRGCGHGDSEYLGGYEESLAVCTKFGGLYDPDAPDSAAVRFTFPDDGRTFKWRIFSTNTCSEQIKQGEGAGCFNVPKNTNIGAVIVYT